jgi:N-acetylmuramoyl-L-alanine amidase
MSMFSERLSLGSAAGATGTPSRRGPVGAWVLALALLLSGSFLAGPAAARPTVESITFHARSDGQGYVVRIQASGTIQAYGMPRSIGDDRLEWTLYNARLHRDYERASPSGPVRRYTTTQRDGHLVIRLHLKRNVQAQAYRDRASDDLLLSLAYRGARPAADAADRSASATGASGSSADASSARASSGQGPSREAAEPASDGSASNEPAATEPASSKAASGTSNRSAGALREARERWKLDTIVIDPGHGGKDPGALGNGLKEKEIVLSVAKKLGDYVENRLGVEVVYTRTDDRFIELEERGHMANRAGGKLFISIHANAARASAAHGAETFFLGPSKSEQARRVMERENSVIKYEDNPDVYEEYDETALVKKTLGQSAFMRSSEQLAGMIQHQFDERVHRRNRGVHQAGFYVLWSASMPSVLVELGFLTNPQEARFLASERGQTYLASAIFRAIRSYKPRYEKGISGGEVARRSE